MTITGTGFISDGLGGAVTVTVGKDECKIVTMSQTEIKCRTIGGSEESPSFTESKILTENDGRSSAQFHRNYWTLGSNPGQVNSAEECRRMCYTDATCLAFIFQSQDPTWNGCWHIDHLGTDLTDHGQNQLEF